jgi:hypothetical protein
MRGRTSGLRFSCSFLSIESREHDGSAVLAKLNKSADVWADSLPLSAGKSLQPLREFSHNFRNKILTFLLQLLIKAVRLFYAALGLFAASALLSVAGSSAAYFGFKFGFELCAGLAIITAASAVIGLSVGCTVMDHETRMAIQSLTEESKLRLSFPGACPPALESIF